MEQFEPRVTLDEHGFATSDGWVEVATKDRESNEFTGCCHEWVSEGTGISAGSYLDRPSGDAPAGKAWVRTADDSKWELVDDHRGLVVYDKTTTHPQTIGELGPLPESVTTQVPPGQFVIWDEAEQSWVTDQVTEQAHSRQMAESQQTTLLLVANQQIAIIAPAVEGGYAKPEHAQLLAAWQRYRYELTQVPEQTGWPDAPQWPTEPDKVI
ncbi:tail fiber assembly protein [Aeromonas sp. D3]|uniref:tail fiber assembly protein n=1 Tax=Aeromonas sp. D3 TaxID=2990474 RepID=UPI0022E069E0|nr:tail fiber assembly protein [Aeromonas sp. D3]